MPPIMRASNASNPRSASMAIKTTAQPGSAPELDVASAGTPTVAAAATPPAAAAAPPPAPPAAPPAAAAEEEALVGTVDDKAATTAAEGEEIVETPVEEDNVGVDAAVVAVVEEDEAEIKEEHTPYETKFNAFISPYT